MPGEQIGSLSGDFKLVTYGSSLHWMNIPVTLNAASNSLGSHGGIAVLGMRSVWGGESEWEQKIVSVVQKWLGEDRRAGSSTFDTSTDNKIRFEDALADAGLTVFDIGNVDAECSVDVPFILGHLYTTSYCNRQLLGDNISEFERELTQELEKLDSSGTYRWSPGASYIFARKSV
ncbi:MAG: hypothetical protein O3B95_08455 [Chloroflexi bacterium]|nr:hypothetical protein [Chloroflexota bacterium]